MTHQVIKHKQGDTFEVSATYSDSETGAPINLDTYQIVSQVRDQAGVLIEQLVVTKADQVELPGQFLLRSTATASWPARELVWDIEYRYDSTVISTETLRIAVQADVSR